MLIPPIPPSTQTPGFYENHHSLADRFGVTKEDIYWAARAVGVGFSIPQAPGLIISFTEADAQKIFNHLSKPTNTL